MNFLIKSVKFPHVDPQADDWQIYQQFKGQIGTFERFSSHTSTLKPNILPHEINSHIEEEIIIIMRGDVEIITNEIPKSQTNNPMILSPGSFVYHSTDRKHTLRCIGPEAAQYLIFKWLRNKCHPLLKMGTFVYHGDITESDFIAVSAGFQILPINGLSNLTNGNLRSHFSFLEPGSGYKTHRDEYDILVVLKEGELQIFNLAVYAPAFVYVASGVPHSFYNPGELPARYFVFEFV